MTTPSNLNKPDMWTPDFYLLMDVGDDICNECAERIAKEQPELAFAPQDIEVFPEPPESDIVCAECGTLIWKAWNVDEE